MTSKTFETAHADNKVLKVDQLFGNPRLLIKEFDGDTRGFAFAPSDAPALALAILEAAGVAESSDAGVAANYLRLHISEQERAAAEAKEQAELETEAEALYLAYFEAADVKCKDWRILDQYIKDYWLAVARRAREMRNEKKVTTDD